MDKTLLCEFLIFFKILVPLDQCWTMVRLHSLCMLQGGRGFFFSAARFFISPPRSIQIFIIPQAISRKMNTPPPLLPHKKYQNKYLYNSTLYMFEISRDMFNKNIERALTVYVIPMPASLSSAN